MSFDLEEVEDNAELQRHIDSKRKNGHCLVEYLDILGFKDHVNRYYNEPQDPLDENILEIISSAMGATKKIVNDFFSSGEFKNTDLLSIKQFSDCICMSMPDFYDSIDNEAEMICMFIVILKGYNYNLIKDDLYLRGGVSIGFHHEDENIIFSDGLIKAYYLESKKAIYPRIILDNELIKRLKRLWKYDKNILVDFGIEKLILVDWEGTAFINLFNLTQSMGTMISKENLEKISSFDDKTLDNIFHKQIMENLEKKITKHKSEADNHILTKYLWLKELLMWNMKSETSKIKFEYLLE